MAQEIINTLKADTRYKKFRKAVEAAQERVDFEKDRSEALNLHSSLLVRSLYGKKQYSSKTLIEAVSQVQANRSRLVELRVRSSIHLSYIKEYSANFRRYVYTQYSDTLKSYKTRDQRDALLLRLTAKAEEFLSEGESHLNLIDTLIKDLDQAGFAMRHMIDVLKLLDGKEGKIL